ncbi:MAG TPA: DUF507 family protein [Terriglobales bacterium]|nr:DUF507 family protein [Terriglobales bacterium]
MRVSREKINQLSHVVAQALAQRAEISFLEDRNTLRLEIRRLLEQMFAAEARMDEVVRLKISSQKKGILEGSGEWDILYRKYYQDELKRLGV